VDKKVFVELSKVLFTEISPCKFNQLYDILVSSFIYSLIQRVEDKDLASHHTKTKENLVEVVHRCKDISFLKYAM
jgi:hypothetical protein